MADVKTDEGRKLPEEEYASLPPENRAVLEWLRGYMSEGLTEEEQRYWEELRQFAEKHPFTFRGEGGSEEATCR